MRDLVGHQTEIVGALAGTKPDVPAAGEGARADSPSSALGRLAPMDPHGTEISIEGCFEPTPNRAVQATGIATVTRWPGVAIAAVLSGITVVRRISMQALASQWSDVSNRLSSFRDELIDTLRTCPPRRCAMILAKKPR
ncbi:MAG TPA: hypothetical protein PKW99_13100 [Thauera sp.]|nr:hypothetical protein [Thauera sp.]